MPKVVTLILAGGQGSRLYPLTKIRSKPAVPVAGRFRLVDVSISNCIHSGYRRIFILTQFMCHQIPEPPKIDSIPQYHAFNYIPV